MKPADEQHDATAIDLARKISSILILPLLDNLAKRL
jgi:hypothetical protein